ncbi:hypothetical protein RB195_002970 [Necator americanus]|uniref:DUF7083 domain-containing protein n=1 Tax=Necator americanus TaxID=51031 RepID=A0ABR1DLH2_NECAM
MEAEIRRTIFENQTKAQQQMFTELMKRMEKMASSSQTAVPTPPVATDVISRDGATLDDAAKARLIVSKFDAVTYARFTNHILPKIACDASLTDTVLALKE